MAAETLAEKTTELAEVKAAISRTLRAQGYSSKLGMSKTNPELAQLREHKKELIKEIDDLERGGIQVQGITTL